MSDLIVQGNYVGYDELTVDEQQKENDAVDVALIRLRYRLLATREINKTRREKKLALTNGTEARLERSLTELRG